MKAKFQTAPIFSPHGPPDKTRCGHISRLVYRGMEDLLLLEIEPGRLTAPLVVEPGDGTDEQFPHLYGELPIDAVIAAGGYRPDNDGHFPAVDGTRLRSADLITPFLGSRRSPPCPATTLVVMS